MAPTDAISIINEHIPSMSEEDEDEIADLAADWPIHPYQGDGPADWAIRTCYCGKRIDGFYEYVDHLKEALK